MDEDKHLPGLTNAEGSLERVPMRTRDGVVTLSAWRLVVSSDEGPGSILLVEAPDGTFYRGDGVFLGWSRDDLARAWQLLGRTPDEPDAPLPQLG